MSTMVKLTRMTGSKESAIWINADYIITMERELYTWVE